MYIKIKSILVGFFKIFRIYFAVLFLIFGYIYIKSNIDQYKLEKNKDNIKKFANENIYNSDNGEAVCNYIKEYCPIISDSNNFEIEFVSKGIKQSKGALILCKSCDEVFYTSQAARDELKIKEKNQLLRNKHGKKPTIFLSNTYTNDIAKYLDTYANNPNSIKDLNCDDPYIDESGWNTYCTYRMENKFGGIQLYKSHFITSSDVTLCGFNCEQFGY